MKQLSTCATTTESAPQSLRAGTTEARWPWSLCNKRSHHNEKPALAMNSNPPLAATSRSLCKNSEDPAQPKIKVSKINFKKKSIKKKTLRGFPHGPVVKNQPCNTREAGSIPGPGRFHMPGGPQLLSLNTATTEVHTP